MKPILNSRTTPCDVGDIIVSRYDRGYHDTRKFKIIKLETCQPHFPPCSGCDTGNVAYIVKRFKKRLGIKTIALCPMRHGITEFVKWEPPLGGQT